VAELARSLRSHGMTSGTWARHTGHQTSYDVTALGFNYRMDEPRAALLLSRMPRLEDDIARRRELVLGYRRRLEGLDGLSVPYRDDEVGMSSCYVMPVMVSDAGRRDEVRARLKSDFGIQTSILYPAIHEFSAYRERYPGVSLPETERASRCEVTLPLYAHMTDAEQDRVVEAVQRVLAG